MHTGTKNPVPKKNERDPFPKKFLKGGKERGGFFASGTLKNNILTSRKVRLLVGVNLFAFQLGPTEISGKRLSAALPAELTLASIRLVSRQLGGKIGELH